LEQFREAKPTLPQDLIDATAAFAVNEEDVASVLATLRVKLFPDVRLVDLPFDLTLVGAPGKPVLMMSRPLYERLIEIKRHLEEAEAKELIVTEQRAHELRAGKAVTVTGRFTATTTARRAAEILSESLPAERYWYLEKVAAPNSEADSIATEVRQALNSP
jgi:hypothetical protein